MYETDVRGRGRTPPTPSWRALGRERAVPVGLVIEDLDEEGRRRTLHGAELTRAWRRLVRQPRPEFLPVDRMPRALIPALPDDALRALGWRPVTAPRWDAAESEVADWVGPPPSRAELDTAFDADGSDGVTEFGVTEFGGTGHYAELAYTDAGYTAPAYTDPAYTEHEQRGWALGGSDSRMPAGSAPRLDGGVADVAGHARRRANGGSVDELLQIDVEGTDPYSLLEMIAAWNRVESLAAYQKRLLAHELARRPQLPAFASNALNASAKSTAPVAAEELSFRLGITRHEALRLLDSGRAMASGTGVLTGAALEHGDIDARKADLLIERTQHLPAELSFEAQARVLDAAPLRTAPQLERDLATVVAEVDPEDFSDRHRRARQARRVGAPRTLPDGMAATSIVWPATDAAAMHTALEAAARTAHQAGDDRTLDQLRCDALATMAHSALASGQIGGAGCCGNAGGPGEAGVAGHGRCQGGCDGADDGARHGDCAGAGDSGCRHGDAGAAGSVLGTQSRDTHDKTDPHTTLTPFRLGAVGGARAEIRITVPLSTLMGADNDVADLEGYGPIPADVARAWAAGGTWRRLVVDPLTKRPIEVTAKKYKPPDWLREQVVESIPTCVAPTCNVSARHADLDHGEAWPAGPTEGWNLHPLCRRNHRLKTEAGFSYRSPREGVYEWVTPTGHVYHTEAGVTRVIDPRPPDRTADQSSPGEHGVGGSASGGNLAGETSSGAILSPAILGPASISGASTNGEAVTGASFDNGSVAEWDDLDPPPF